MIGHFKPDCRSSPHACPSGYYCPPNSTSGLTYPCPIGYFNAISQVCDSFLLDCHFLSAISRLPFLVFICCFHSLFPIPLPSPDILSLSSLSLSQPASPRFVSPGRFAASASLSAFLPRRLRRLQCRLLLRLSRSLGPDRLVRGRLLLHRSSLCGTPRRWPHRKRVSHRHLLPSWCRCALFSLLSSRLLTFSLSSSLFLALSCSSRFGIVNVFCLKSVLSLFFSLQALLSVALRAPTVRVSASPT